MKETERNLNPKAKAMEKMRGDEACVCKGAAVTCAMPLTPASWLLPPGTAIKTESHLFYLFIYYFHMPTLPSVWIFICDG